MSQYCRWHCCRIIKTMTYMLYLIHIETCGYYAVSEYEGLNSNRWVYNAQGNAYDVLSFSHHLPRAESVKTNRVFGLMIAYIALFSALSSHSSGAV